MTVQEITPAVDTEALLAGAQFADAFRVEVAERGLDARQAAERIMSRQPRWAEALPAPRGMIGIFPVLSETPDRLIAGFNDSHLDFRVVIDVTAPEGVRQVTLTTLVKTHNWFGRTYLAIITPFHRLIAPALLRQVAG
jgi:hypothetical protein